MEGRIHKKKNQHKEEEEEEEEEEKVDRFSKLPETLILFILSFLEMQDVVKTSVLSKSWKNLWTKAYNIVLSCDNNRNDVHKMSDRDWVSSFDQTLMKCNADIDKFSLERGDRMFYWPDLNDVLDKWIKHLMDRKVKILILKLSNYVAPPSIFQSSSITEMELVCTWFDVFDMSFIPISLSSLKILILDTIFEVNDGFIQNILMGCPVLESFAILKVEHIHEIKIMSPRLKRFKLGRLDNEGEPNVAEDEDEHQPQGEGEGESNRLEIKAPWLQELEITGHFLTTNFQLVGISCLKKATITAMASYENGREIFTDANEVNEYTEMWILMVRKVLTSVFYVNELTIGSDPIQVLSLCKVLGTPSPSFNCKQVSIETCLWKFDLPGLACLLENAPHLETLFIKVDEDLQVHIPLYQTKMLFEDGDPHLGMPIGKFLHLKNVKIDYWRSHSCHDSTDQNRQELFDFEIAEYILRSAVVLEKLVLCSSRSRCSFRECPVPSCSLQRVSRLSFKLIHTCKNLKKPSEWDINEGENMREFTFQNDASLHPTTSAP